MKILGKVSALFASMLFLVAGVRSQTVDLRLTEMLNDGAHYEVGVQIEASSAFKLGSSNLVFTFNSAALDSPSVSSTSNFSGGSYDAISIFRAASQVSVNIALNSVGSGTIVSTTYMDVCTIRFKTIDKNSSSNLQWLPTSGGITSVFKDDEATQISTNTLVNLNTSPLPIQLSSFTASLASASGATLNWTTLSETNNYGFYVQKSATAKSGFSRINTSIIAGHGTTASKHEYTYTDAAYSASETYYRLEQVDLDGTSSFSDPVQPAGVTSVDERPLPKSFAMDQNYPNPFNPTTNIGYAVPKESHVTIVLYNVIGQKVATLVDEVKPAGFYSARVNGASLASGMYIYRMSAGTFSSIKKMMLVK